jgi:vacuolar-type H+-ATPase subunit C/Vma6
MEAIVVSADRDSLYAYTYGMVSGMYGRLLRKQDIELLLQSGSVEEVLTGLDNTPYGEFIRDIKPGFSLQDIDGALSSAFRRAYINLTVNLPASDRKMLDRIILGGLDVDNIKTVIRSVKAGQPQVTGMFSSYGHLDARELGELAGLTDVGEVAARLPEPHSAIVEAARGKQTQLEFEEEVDRRFTATLIEDARGQLGDYVGLLVDVLNIRTILRCKLQEVEATPHIIPGGYHIKPKKLTDMARTDAEGMANTLLDTPYHQQVRDTIQGVGDCTIDNLDVRLNGVLTLEAENQALRWPVGVASVIAYLRRRQAETDSIRAVIAGKWYGLSVSELRGMLA